MGDADYRRRLLYFYIVGGDGYDGMLRKWLERLRAVPVETIPTLFDGYIRNHRAFGDVVDGAGGMDGTLKDMFFDEVFISMLNDQAKDAFLRLDVGDILTVLATVCQKGMCEKCSTPGMVGVCPRCQGRIGTAFPEIVAVGEVISRHKKWFSDNLRQAQSFVRGNMIC